MKIGTLEIVAILAVVLIIFGPTQIPKLTKMFGRSVKNFKDGMSGEDEAREEKAKAPDDEK